MTSTAYSNSPAIFRRWAAISTIGAALQRKVYLVIQGEKLFCNFYTILVGPPGVGKTRAIRPGSKLLSTLKDFTLSPNKMSPEKLIDNMSNRGRVITSPDGKIEVQTAYACFLDELSTFIRANDLDFMTLLTDLFDCPRTWSYQTMSRGDSKLENVHLSICGGITPKSIQRNWGEGAIGMGFTARLNLIYSEDSTPIDLFGQVQEADLSSFAYDLSTIYSLQGNFQVTNSAKKELQEWVTAGMPPIPADTRFAEYNPRRSIHLLKLCMVYSVAESNALIITSEHVAKARETLLEYEAVLPLVFEHMGQNPMLSALTNLHQWLKIEYGLTKKPIIEARLRRKLLTDVPPQYLEATLREFVDSGMATVTPTATGKGYTPIMTRRTE